MRVTRRFCVIAVLTLSFFAGPAAANPQPWGTCCFPEGYCEIFDQDDCIDAGGYFMGDIYECDPNPCFGACCAELSGCSETDYWSCVLPLGTFMGPFTTCLDDPCSVGACCLSDGACVMLHAENCEAQGGTFTIGMYPRSPYPCQHLGACCRPDLTCYVTVELLCSGEWQGEGGSCQPDPCDPAAVPSRTALPFLTAAPNPFAGETFVRLSSPAGGLLSCRIVDAPWHRLPPRASISPTIPMRAAPSITRTGS